ncbi:tetratricopeptide repeat protein [Armatimonas sp.]|uniref:tetratricopeptide repeat protein n=1 Tax=Armatimonas sp. TaxID=1872638 RepID=UPI00286A7FCB|nr:tetratricopeptide repeat protein [Armatimonas sp.]
MESDTLKTAYSAAQRLSHAGKLEEAIALLEPFLALPYAELDDTLQNALILSVTLKLQCEQLGESEKRLEAALGLATPTQEVELHLLRSKIFDFRGHNRKAATEREKAVTVAEALDEPTRLLIGVLKYQQEGDFETVYKTAIEAMAVGGKSWPQIARLQYFTAFAAYNRGRYDDARQWISKTLVHPQSTAIQKTECLRLRALCAGLEGNYAEALEQLQSAANFARIGADWSTAVELTLALGESLLLLGRCTDAQELMGELEQRFPRTQAKVEALRARIALERGDLAATEAHLTNARHASRKHDDNFYVSAMLAQERGDYPEALRILESALRQMKAPAGLNQTKCLRAPLLWRCGKPEEAETEARLLREQFSESAPRQHQRTTLAMEAELAYLKEDWVSGIAAWKQVLRLEPHPVNLPEDWTLLGDGYAKQGESAAALFAWQRAAAQPVESIWVRRAKERLEAS